MKKEKTGKKTLKKKDAKEEKTKELTETLQRLQAEFENYRKRIEKEKNEFVSYASRDIMLKLLPILDNFELALKNSHSHKEFCKGMELIYSQIISTLESEGVKPISVLNEKFDPYKHEALLAEKSDKEENTVIEELQKGYMYKDKVLRPAKVKVAKKG